MGARNALVGAVVALAVWAWAAEASLATTVEFYTGVDLWLSSSNAADTGNSNLGWGRSIGANARNYDALIKFTDMFGDGADQIPLGSTISSADLYMWVYGDNGLTSSIYEMTFDWNASSTWLSIGSAGGIVPGVNTVPDPELSWTGAVSGWHQTSFDLTPSVQDWSDGAANYGWGFTRPRSGAVTGISFDYSTPSYRPYLVVEFTPAQDPPAPVPEPVTACGLLLGAGSLATYLRRRRR